VKNSFFKTKLLKKALGKTMLTNLKRLKLTTAKNKKN